MRLILICLLGSFSAFAQKDAVSKTWVADNGDGTYKNPVLHADYSDPDAVRVGNDFYMTSSSFEDIPGLPILHSKDLVNWKLIGHALKLLAPYDHFAVPRHGGGVWAPAIRYHKGEFYIYYPDPDFGIFLVKAKNPAGPWSPPILVEGGAGLIDPCPLWDDDGKVYLVHAFAGSRAGIKSVIVIKEMNAEGTSTTSPGVMVFDGHETDPTIEGPKLYKRNGFYYIFAPAGGVPTGWQLVLRSKNIYGPYERKVVMDQGSSPVNGPHQGAWVNTPSGEDWFLHFQDKDAYGRVVHLQPMKWVNNWPVIGEDKDGDGKGNPVMRYRKPLSGAKATPAESDEFNANSMGLQWQWTSNPKPFWNFQTGSALRLFSDQWPDSARNLWGAGNVLQQKFPALAFKATTQLQFKPNAKLTGEKAGLVIMGFSYAGLALKKFDDGIYMVYTVCKDAEKGAKEREDKLVAVPSGKAWLRVQVADGGICSFSYSLDGISWILAGEPFTAEVGRWIGAKVGLFCSRNTKTNDSGYADFDWFRVE